MINLSTTPKEIIQTMKDELPSAYYFFRKQYGGRQKYLKAEDKLLDKALEEEQSQFTDIATSISKTGNRWMVYTHVEYFPKAHYANAFHFAFVYYETYSSCGAFFPMYPQTKKGKKIDSLKPNGVLIFTSHFFQRLSERTGIPYRSKELIREFISAKSTQACQADEDGDVIIKFKGGYGYGKEKSLNPRVIEVRTFLTNEQLSPSQKRKCENVDALDEIYSDGMWIKDVAISTAYYQDPTEEEAAQEGLKKLKALKKLGLEYSALLMAYTHAAFISLLEYILNIEIDMKQSAVISHITGDCCKNFVLKYKNFNGSTATDAQNEEFKEDFIEVMVKCAKRMKLKSVNRDTITQHINEVMKESQRVTENYLKEADE